MKKQRLVYVVDDDSSARIGLKRLLVTAGYNVEAFASVNEFVNTLRSDATGIIIIDIKVPGMSGKELIEILKKQSQFLPIIVVSSDEDELNREKAGEMNAVGFFRKPVDGPALIDAIEWALKDNKV